VLPGLQRVPQRVRVTDPAPVTVEEFFDLRDRHFLAKREWVLGRHASERAWYDAAFPPAPGEDR
jgi:hypothetical protein